MNSKRFALLMLLAIGIFSLTGESCFLESKNIEVPLKGNADMAFTSTGTSDMDTEMIDFGQELTDLENDADNDIETLVSIGIENAYWRLVENNGDPGTTVTGSVTVTRLSTGVTKTLIAPTSLAIESVGTEFVVAPVDPDGIALLTAGFDEYVDYRNGIGSFPDLRYDFDWSSSGGTGSVDFDWEARIRYTLVGVFTVEVPEL